MHFKQTVWSQRKNGYSQSRLTQRGASPIFKENMMNNFRFEVRRNGLCIFTSAPMSEDDALEQASLREKDEIGITAEVYEDDNQDCGNYHPYGDPQI